MLTHGVPIGFCRTTQGYEDAEIRIMLGDENLKICCCSSVVQCPLPTILVIIVVYIYVCWGFRQRKDTINWFMSCLHRFLFYMGVHYKPTVHGTEPRTWKKKALGNVQC